MMYKVTLKQGVILPADKLSVFLALAGVPAEIEPYAPEPTADPVGAKQPTAPRESKPRAPREPKPRAPAAPTLLSDWRQESAAAGEGAPAAPAATTATVDRAALMTRFTGLVDSRYDDALTLLTRFGTDRFSRLADEQLAAFDAAMSELETAAATA